jgi:outer membrane immunogenic protein
MPARGSAGTSETGFPISRAGSRSTGSTNINPPRRISTARRTRAPAGRSASYALGGPAAKTSFGADEFRVALITPVGAGWRPGPELGPADWSGAYFGAIGGAARQTISTKGLGASNSFAASGALGGIYSGRNWMFGSAMLGVDGSTTFSGVQGSGPQPGAPSTRYRDYFDGAFRGRAGYAFGRFLPFVAAGLAWGDSDEIDTANGHYRDAIMRISGVAALGVDYMATDRVAFRLEYLHTATLGSTATRLEAGGCCAQTVSSDGFRVGVGYFLH